jgi:hypothetical protein
MSEILKLFTEKEQKSKHFNEISTLLENTIKTIRKFNPSFTLEEAISYTTGALGTIADNDTNGIYQKLSLGLSKRTWDRLIAREIVGVQPLSGPVGLYYALRYYASGTYAGGTDTEVGFNKADSTYTGSYSTSAGEPLGSNTNIGLGIGDDTLIKELNVKLEKKQAEAVSRKLRASFSEELFQDVFAMHSLNLREQTWDAIAREIATEIDLEVINKLDTVATSNSLDFATVAGDNKSDKYNSFVSYIITLANRIGTLTNHGVGNFVIANANVCTCLESSQQFAVSLLNDFQDD